MRRVAMSATKRIARLIWADRWLAGLFRNASRTRTTAAPTPTMYSGRSDHPPA
jgi:hypothetical protein